MSDERDRSQDFYTSRAEVDAKLAETATRRVQQKRVMPDTVEEAHRAGYLAGMAFAEARQAETEKSLSNNWQRAAQLASLTGIKPSDPAYGDVLGLALGQVEDDRESADWSEDVRTAIYNEREACLAAIANIKRTHHTLLTNSDTDPAQAYELGRNDGYLASESAIRARGEMKAKSHFDGTYSMRVTAFRNGKRLDIPPMALPSESSLDGVSIARDASCMSHFASTGKPHDPTKPYPECCGGLASPVTAAEARQQIHLSKQCVINDNLAYGIDAQGIYRCPYMRDDTVWYIEREFAVPIVAYLAEKGLNAGNIERVEWNRDGCNAVYYEWKDEILAYMPLVDDWSHIWKGAETSNPKRGNPLFEKVSAINNSVQQQSVQAQIDALPPEGGVVELPPGTMLVKGLKIPPGVTLRMVGESIGKVNALLPSFDANGIPVVTDKCSRCGGALGSRVAVCEGCEPDQI